METERPGVLLVGRLGYWTYWISKYAEAAESKEEKNQLFQMKSNGLTLLAKSEYVQIRKYVPGYHSKLCYKHHDLMKKSSINPHLFLYKNAKHLVKCQKCKALKKEEHYYSLYSVAVLNEKEDIDRRKPLFIMYSPYPTLKDHFPELVSLQPVKYYGGFELAVMGNGMKSRDVEKDAIKKRLS